MSRVIVFVTVTTSLFAVIGDVEAQVTRRGVSQRSPQAARRSVRRTTYQDELPPLDVEPGPYEGYDNRIGGGAIGGPAGCGRQCGCALGRCCGVAYPRCFSFHSPCLGGACEGDPCCGTIFSEMCCDVKNWFGGLSARCGGGLGGGLFGGGYSSCSDTIYGEPGCGIESYVEPGCGIESCGPPGCDLAVDCEPSCGIAAPCEPSCGIAAPCEPSCGIAAPCEPSCGIAYACEPSCGIASAGRCGGTCFQDLFRPRCGCGMGKNVFGSIGNMLFGACNGCGDCAVVSDCGGCCGCGDCGGGDCLNGIRYSAGDVFEDDLESVHPGPGHCDGCISNRGGASPTYARGPSTRSHKYTIRRDPASGRAKYVGQRPDYPVPPPDIEEPRMAEQSAEIEPTSHQSVIGSGVRRSRKASPRRRPAQRSTEEPTPAIRPTSFTAPVAIDGPASTGAASERVESARSAGTPILRLRDAE